MRRFVGWFGAVALLVLGACDQSGGIAGPEAPFRFGVPSDSSAGTVVVGTWTRSISFVDSLGIPRTTETTWVFNANGSATRSIVTRGFLDAVVNRQDATASWEVQGDSLVIDFTAPFTSRVQLAVQREGDRLILGGQTFLRVF